MNEFKKFFNKIVNESIELLVGDKVNCPTNGNGKIMNIDDGEVTIKWDDDNVENTYSSNQLKNLTKINEADNGEVSFTDLSSDVQRILKMTLGTIDKIDKISLIENNDNESLSADYDQINVSIKINKSVVIDSETLYRLTKNASFMYITNDDKKMNFVFKYDNSMALYK